MSPLTIDFSQGNQLENKEKVREIRILKLVATLPEHFLNKFKDVKKNALLCNTCRIRVMKDEVLEEG